jgi:hypothetical protein
MAREQSQHGQHEADHGQGHGQKDEELPDWLHLGLLLGQVSFAIPLVSFFFFIGLYVGYRHDQICPASSKDRWWFQNKKNIKK